ncbi:dihydroneopterin aldolase [Neisseria sp. P0004.S004]|jgi:dihydroneopterin aldolase|uniref:dihydroneopterin aldolase n=1 Tax=Neisseria TaxID=482 RepID=UPI00066D6F2D|nr:MULTISPECIES: dihydroneopterin aldolase [Neisseria]MBF1350236.1 dihydroneopterin aldolase [Neisseria lactamica]OHP51448.1 dienelactone hydrolase [Neisseria sp. HMSC061B04]
MDKIFLYGMKADTLIGVYDWERERKQTLILDLEISVPERTGTSDDIGDTIHYGEVCEVVRRNLAEQDFLLLETLAEHIAQLILNDFGAAKVRVRIVKPGILPDVAQVGIEIERVRE